MILAFLVFIPLCLAHPLYAYLDPGSGSLFLQILMASLFGSLYVFKTFWSKIFSSLRRMFRKKKP